MLLVQFALLAFLLVHSCCCPPATPPTRPAARTLCYCTARLPAEVVAPQLEALKLVGTEAGRTTCAFLSGSSRLRELQLDFWGRSNRLPRAMADCTALTKLTIQCSSGLEGHTVLASLQSLQVSARAGRVAAAVKNGSMQTRYC